MQLERFLDVSQAESVEAFERQVIQMAGELGFGLVTGALVIDSPLDRGKVFYRRVGNMPQAFENASYDKDATARDPVLRRMKQLSVPFAYDQQLYVAENAGDLWEEQAAFGYKAGIAVALHLPDHHHFLLGVDRDPLPQSVGHLTRMMADLQFFAVHAQAAATRLLAPSREAGDVPRFSAREMEVLKWTQAGKSAWETGMIIGLSEQGVQYHLRSILKKLDVNSKHQAVLKAISFGLLQP
jgi:DNA-binding CsgD family transcriptional regulator